ncbi:MAG: hypothetical protein ACP5N2_03870 [Candidatus Nanoarchaeia archaeon]
MVGAYTGTTPREASNFACIGDAVEDLQYHINKKVKLIQDCCIYSPVFEKKDLLTISPLFTSISLTDFLIQTGNIGLPE